MKSAPQILIADDHAVVRQGLKSVLAQEYPEAVFGEAQDALHLLKQIRQQVWDIVILDINMPGRSGLDVLKELRQEKPQLPVLVLSIHPEDQYAMRVLKAGAEGYMTKDSAASELAAAVRKVLEGSKHISSSLAAKIATGLGSEIEEPLHTMLSDREYEVFGLIAAGKTTAAIAEALSLSVKTVSTYRSRVLSKMKMKTNAELTHYALQHRLLD